METAVTQFKLRLPSDMGGNAAKSPFTPIFPTAESISAAQGLLRYVVNTLGNPDVSESRSTAIDMGSAYALHNTVIHTASSIGQIINASLPATRLPPEILAAIFSLVPRPYENPFNISHFPQRSYAVTRADDLRPITEVCRYWRQVALHTPSLWSAVAEPPPKDSNFYCRAPFWHYYIHRCISGPLHVDVNACVSEETFALLGQHRDRVRSLSVAGNSKRVQEDDNLLALSIPLPNVEHCQIADTYFGRSLPGTRPTTALRILGGSCARLRCLVLWNVVFIPSNSFPALTSFIFCLHNSPDYQLGIPELWTSLLEFLSKSPALRTISILNVAHLGVSRSLNLKWKPLEEKIQLPNLRELSLQDHNYWDGFCHGHTQRYEPNVTISKYRSSFLGAIHISPTCRLHLGPVYNPSDMLAICSPLPSLGWRIPTIARMVSRVDDKAKTLSVETSDLDAPELEQIHLHVDIDAPWHCPNYPSLSSLPIFARLRELWIELDVYASFIRAGGFLNLAELGNLETLVICRATQIHDDPAEDLHHHPHFYCYQQRPPTLATARNILQPLEVSGPSFSGPASCPCPCLATLRVDVVESTSAMNNADEAGYVRELAASRAAAGCPIFRLLIGVIFRADFPASAYVVSQFDAEGQLTSIGDHESDGLAEHWRKRMPAD